MREYNGFGWRIESKDKVWTLTSPKGLEVTFTDVVVKNIPKKYCGKKILLQKNGEVVGRVSDQAIPCSVVKNLVH